MSRRNVVVGLSLALPSKRSSGEENGDEDSGEDGDVRERERFLGILEMVSRWSPEEVELAQEEE